LISPVLESLVSVKSCQSWKRRPRQVGLGVGHHVVVVVVHKLRVVVTVSVDVVVLMDVVVVVSVVVVVVVVVVGGRVTKLTLVSVIVVVAQFVIGGGYEVVVYHWVVVDGGAQVRPGEVVDVT